MTPSCPVIAEAAKKGRIYFEANVSGTGGKPHLGGLGGDHEKPGKGATWVALRYHKFKEYRNLSKEQQEELTKWNKANGGGKNHDKKKGKHSLPAGRLHNKSDNAKKFKSMISAMEAQQNELFEAMADVQTTSVAAIRASSTSPAASPCAAGVGAVVGSAAGVAPEVMIECANVAMFKLTGVLKSKDKA